MEQQIKEVIDYCYERCEDAGGETAHDVYLDIAKQLADIIKENQ